MNTQTLEQKVAEKEAALKSAQDAANEAQRLTAELEEANQELKRLRIEERISGLRREETDCVESIAGLVDEINALSLEFRSKLIKLERLGKRLSENSTAIRAAHGTTVNLNRFNSNYSPNDLPYIQNKLDGGGQVVVRPLQSLLEDGAWIRANTDLYRELNNA